MKQECSVALYPGLNELLVLTLRNGSDVAEVIQGIRFVGRGIEAIHMHVIGCSSWVGREATWDASGCFICNALVICKHGPQPRGIAGTLTFFVFQSPAITPTLWGQSAGKTTAVFPSSLLCFHRTSFFLPIITQTPGISPALWGQCKSKITAHFHGYPPPSPGAGGGGCGYK